MDWSVAVGKLEGGQCGRVDLGLEWAEEHRALSNASYSGVVVIKQNITLHENLTCARQRPPISYRPASNGG